MHILSRLQRIKTFVFDMDGVLTDGGLIITHEGQWLRRMNVRDGYALQLAVKSGFTIIVISGSDSPQIAERLEKLGVTHVFMNVKEKEKFLREFALKNKLDLDETLFMGDDIPDYSCMQMVGVAACPADAAFEIKEIAAYISPLRGGYGCVRDVLEKVLKLNNKWTLQSSVAST
ncbi:MAG: HAD-IIIA family hydrolase [Ginsengibacter sp.]